MQHLEKRNLKQTIMLGFSDGTKEDGCCLPLMAAGVYKKSKRGARSKFPVSMK